MHSPLVNLLSLIFGPFGYKMFGYYSGNSKLCKNLDLVSWTVSTTEE